MEGGKENPIKNDGNNLISVRSGRGQSSNKY